MEHTEFISSLDDETLAIAVEANGGFETYCVGLARITGEPVQRVEHGIAKRLATYWWGEAVRRGVEVDVARLDSTPLAVRSWLREARERIEGFVSVGELVEIEARAFRVRRSGWVVSVEWDSVTMHTEVALEGRDHIMNPTDYTRIYGHADAPDEDPLVQALLATPPPRAEPVATVVHARGEIAAQLRQIVDALEHDGMTTAMLGALIGRSRRSAWGLLRRLRDVGAVRSEGWTWYRTELEVRIENVDGMVPCRSCGDWSTTLWCGRCAASARCPHGAPVDACDACLLEGDLAHDAAREG